MNRETLTAALTIILDGVSDLELARALYTVLGEKRFDRLYADLLLDLQLDELLKDASEEKTP